MPESSTAVPRPDSTEEPLDRVVSMADWSGEQGTGRWAILCGDALDVLSRMPGEWVDCAITSPPYFWLRDYGVDGSDRIGTQR